jgi:hypothetical protein
MEKFVRKAAAQTNLGRGEDFNISSHFEMRGIDVVRATPRGVAAPPGVNTR